MFLKFRGKLKRCEGCSSKTSEAPVSATALFFPTFLRFWNGFYCHLNVFFTSVNWKSEVLAAWVNVLWRTEVSPTVRAGKETDARLQWHGDVLHQGRQGWGTQLPQPTEGDFSVHTSSLATIFCCTSFQSPVDFITLDTWYLIHLHVVVL